MRRTLTTAVMTLAILAPGAAAFADTPSQMNGSCNNGKGGNGAEYNGNGHDAQSDRVAPCLDAADQGGKVHGKTAPVDAPVGAWG